MSPAEPVDPGAQPERTVLAWRRTALLIAANGVLLTRAAPTLGPVALVLGGLVAAAAVPVWLAAAIAYRKGRPGSGTDVLTARAMRALTGLLVVIALLDLTAALLHR
ncbi:MULTISPECIES: DUF202 domain-containing protein [Thermomonospora]|uniref:DUF202 domain-containing protein n=1 Tax=Thermomonospora curvata (strain ATCC 19995 / DSM 43183 / JCM 3096 / KCTC 9072 / NBRC 15933 / NCIMB 10081 / Henssen B9) TaxID=471852 RepID=D1A5Z3_THECD|nr:MULTISPECIES: DUF202 domain-containing protein [Thermomonospora]ACY98288.1 hypothetical protein Tcur_2741 [Thermomonospora curvata DSM 43183]PKK13457.1 MAG: DUF202 domain-containing protein [Thermomonospora sp. CIF 1]